MGKVFFVVTFQWLREKQIARNTYTHIYTYYIRRDFDNVHKYFTFTYYTDVNNKLGIMFYKTIGIGTKKL